MARRDWKAALPDLSTASVVHRDDPELLLLFAEARRRVPKTGLRHLTDAAGIYRAAIEAGASKEGTQPKLLAVLMDAQQFVEAADLARQILERNPNDPAALEALVGTLMLRGKYADSIALLEKAIAATPSDIALRSALIDAMVRSGAKPADVRARIDAWIAEPGAPRVLRDLRAAVLFDEEGAGAVELDPPFDDAWRPLDAAEASFRSRLLARLGRIDDACRALELGRAVAPGEASLLRDEIRYRFFAGRTEGLVPVIDALAGIAPSDDADAVERAKALRDALQCALVVWGGASDQATAALEALQPASDSLEAEWRNRLLESFRTGAAPRALRVASFGDGADPILVAVYDLRRARMLAESGDAAEAAVSAREAYLASEGQWRPAALLMMRALLDSGRFGEAAAGARLFARQSGGDPELRLLALEAEGKARLAGLAAGRDVSKFADELREVLSAPGASPEGRRVAIEGLFIAGARDEARAAARALLDDPSLSQSDAGTVARIGDGLGRSMQDAAPARSAAERLKAMGADPWLQAEIEAVACELEGDPMKGLEALLAAAGTDRTNIAKAGLYADRLVPAKASAIFARSLPEGAAAAMTSRVVTTDPALARAAIESLEKQGGGLPYAFGLLRMSAIDPASYPADKSLLVAEEARRDNPNDAQLLVAMAEVVAAGGPANRNAAVDLMRQAFRLDVSRLDFLGRALAMAAGDQALLASLAEELLGAAGGDVVARRLVVAALCDAGQVQRAADSAIRIAEVTGLDEDVALAGRTLAMAGDPARSERLLKAALERSGSWPQTMQVLAAVQRLLGKDAEARETLRLAGGASDPVERALDAARDAEEKGDAAAFAAALGGADAKDARVGSYLRDVVLRRGPLAEPALARIGEAVDAKAAARVALAAATYGPTLPKDVTSAAALDLAREARDDWAGWIAAIRIAARRGESSAAAAAAAEALAALPRELRLGVDAIDALTNAGRFGDAERAAAVLISVGSLEPSLREAAARLEIARGDGTKALLQLDAIVDAAAKGRTRDLRAQAFALKGDMKAAAVGASEPALLRVAPMLDGAQIDALWAELAARPGLSPRMLAEIAFLRARAAPGDAAVRASATDAARRVLALEEQTAETLASAFTTALAGDDAAVVNGAREAFLRAVGGTAAELVAGTGSPDKSDAASRFAAVFVLNNEADAIRRQGGDLKRAVPLAQRALALAAPAQRPSVETTLARCMVADGRAEEALAMLAQGEPTALRLFARAEALAKLGRRDDAERELALARSALASTPYASRATADEMAAMAEKLKAMPRSSRAAD